MSTRPKDYVLKESTTVKGLNGSGELPAGAFVKPISLKYVPKHILDDNRWFNESTEVYVYCRYGIVPVRKDLVIPA